MSLKEAIEQWFKTMEETWEQLKAAWDVLAEAGNDSDEEPEEKEEYRPLIFSCIRYLHRLDRLPWYTSGFQ